MLFLDDVDSLYVLDGAQQWTVFDPQLQPVRRFPGDYSGRAQYGMHILTGYGVLTTGGQYRERGTDDGLFHVMDLNGDSIGSFGPAVLQGDSHARARISVLDDADGFWTTAPDGAYHGVLLERWTLDGRMSHEVMHSTTWLPKDGYPPASNASEPQLPEYDLLHLDRDGLLWVALIVRDERWKPTEDTEDGARGPLADELFDARVEVIDPGSGAVLVSYRRDGPGDELPPFSRFARGNRSYRFVRDSSGVTRIELFDIHLVAHSND